MSSLLYMRSIMSMSAEGGSEIAAYGGIRGNRPLAYGRRGGGESSPRLEIDDASALVELQVDDYPTPQLASSV